MKILLFTCCFLLMLSCDKEKSKTKKPIFLVGDWIRVNDKKGSITYEKWNANLKGLGYTLKENDTTFKEILNIVTLDDTLFLKVEGVNENPTLFKFTQQTDSSFVCENPKNEFPKKIKYYIENNHLKATVSTEDFKIEFIFEKL
ncbi:hypothetical protein [Polaribacter sp. Hel1_85]|uniref:hypothetical protein n=1 Tax=Polaribacter sp. Hel1_85 TaxID=1250005 RepID=UPI00052CF9A2|nr:hypothetical protein [Polaribacter sp. Hel1_85]KGL61683.1 hypothetical protein PHEL85_1464 [Polaribacter sp. Hel1_85]